MSTSARTCVNISLLILVNILTKTQCNDVIRPQKYSMPLSGDHLLRSSEEHPEKLLEDNPEETLDVIIAKEILNEYVEPDIKDAIPKTTENNNLTTDHSQITDDTEALAHINDDNTKIEDINESRKLDNEDIPTSVQPEVETTVVDETMSLDSPNVDKQREIVDGMTVNNNVEMGQTAKTEQPSTTATPEEMEAVVAVVARFDDPELLGQRSPKTDAEPTQQLDKPHFDLSKTYSDPDASKSTILRDWMEDSWLRSPPGLLVPLRAAALTRALAVWRDLTSGAGLNVSDIVVVGFDANGVNWRSRHSLVGHGGSRAVSEVLSKLLFKYQDVPSDEVAGDATMLALASAAKLVPYDSALFVLTDQPPADGSRLPLAHRALLEKRLKVYTIWTDPHYPSPASVSALRELRNISAYTEGDVLAYSMEVLDTESSSQGSRNRWHSMDSLQARMAKARGGHDDVMECPQTLLVKRGGGAISLGVPIETGVTALRVFIEGAVEHAVLYPPNEAPQIDLYSLSSVRQFSPESSTISYSPRDVSLIFPGASSKQDLLSVLPMSTARHDGPEPTAGVWHLSMRCDTCDYRLTVCARARIQFHTELLKDDMINLRVVGPVSVVRESTLVDEYGNELGKLNFSYQPHAGDAAEEPHAAEDHELVADVPLPSVKGSRVYAKIMGRDIHGESFVRLSGPLRVSPEPRVGRSASITFSETPNDLELAEQYNERLYDSRFPVNDSNVLPSGRGSSQIVNQRGTLLTAVQIGLSSRIYGAPGDNLQLHFEVTNYRDQAVSFRFEAVGELRFLRGISPTSQTVTSGQTVNVIVSVGITTSAQPGARDLITFTAYGIDQVSISTYVYVVNTDTINTDFWAPTLRHEFQGTCIGRLGDDCAQHIWSATVVARDAVSGLLRLTSSPVGIHYNSDFVAGSRDEVRATYRATCCAPRVMVTAVDAFGNANSQVIDISSYFTPASIVAIVLGVLLIIALIAIIVFLVYWCVRRRKESQELSYVTSTSRRDIN